MASRRKSLGVASKGILYTAEQLNTDIPLYLKMVTGRLYLLLFLISSALQDSAVAFSHIVIYVHGKGV